MSYARFGWDGSDVYVFGTRDGPEGKRYIECCGCLLHPDREDEQVPWGAANLFDTREGALAHMQEHMDAGHFVPEYCIDRLQTDDWVE